jgi:hypothetical protein
VFSAFNLVVEQHVRSRRAGVRTGCGLVVGAPLPPAEPAHRLHHPAPRAHAPGSAPAVQNGRASDSMGVSNSTAGERGGTADASQKSRQRRAPG